MSSNTCNYILKKGKNKGQSCGIKCIVNTLLCKKHSVDDENINEPKKSKEPNEPKKSKEPKEPKKSKESKDKKSKEPKKSKEKELKEKKEASEKINIIEKQKIQAKRNSQGNYVLFNNLVVHPINKNIIGRQDGDKIVEISIEDIEYCKEHGFRYLQPSVMYFIDSDIEKKEVELHKLMIKSQNKNNNNDDLDNLEEEEESEHEEEDD